MKQAIIVELIKLGRSRVGQIGAGAMIAGIVLICAGLLLGVHNQNPQILAEVAPLDITTWEGYFAMTSQITGVAALLGFGVVLAWQFAREFTDGTISGLFALPISRAQIALAKIVAYGIWAVVVSILLTLALVLVAFVFGIGGPVDQLALLRQFFLTLMSALVVLPVALVATLGRSLLAGVGTAIGLIVFAQVAVIIGVGGWFTPAAPALWAISEGKDVSLLQLLLVAPVASLFVVLTSWVWRTLQLDR